MEKRHRLERLLKLRQEQYGEQDWRVMLTQLKLVLVLAELQDFVKMTEFSDHLMAIARHSSGSERMDLALSLSGKMALLLQKCLVLQHGLASLDPTDSADVPRRCLELTGFLLKFGVCHQLLGDEVTQNALERFVQILEQRGGWTEVALGLKVLATRFWSQTAWEASGQISLLERAFDLLEREYGTKHTVTAVASELLENLSLYSLYDQLGRLPKTRRSSEAWKNGKGNMVVSLGHSDSIQIQSGILMASKRLSQAKFEVVDTMDFPILPFDVTPLSPGLRLLPHETCFQEPILLLLPVIAATGTDRAATAWRSTPGGGWEHLEAVTVFNMEEKVSVIPSLRDNDALSAEMLPYKGSRIFSSDSRSSIHTLPVVDDEISLPHHFDCDVAAFCLKHFCEMVAGVVHDRTTVSPPPPPWPPAQDVKHVKWFLAVPPEGLYVEVYSPEEPHTFIAGGPVEQQDCDDLDAVSYARLQQVAARMAAAEEDTPLLVQVLPYLPPPPPPPEPELEDDDSFVAPPPPILAPLPPPPEHEQAPRQPQPPALPAAPAVDFPEDERTHLMVSGRFNDEQMVAYMKTVRDILVNVGVPVFMVDTQGAGDAFGTQTLQGLYTAKALLAFCGQSYGQRTGARYETYVELRYAHDNDLEIIPIQLCDIFPPRPPDVEGRCQNHVIFRRDVMRIVDKDMSKPEHVADEILRAWTCRLQQRRVYAKPY
ncbi:unnamed protein product [Symbiodinium sp. CCMP2592]|nr:unnamed protein product [Symbiodinium sp. CCMP2592]